MKLYIIAISVTLLCCYSSQVGSMTSMPTEGTIFDGNILAEVELIGQVIEKEGEKFLGTVKLPYHIELPMFVLLKHESSRKNDLTGEIVVTKRDIWYEVETVDGVDVFNGVSYKLDKDKIVRYNNKKSTKNWIATEWMKGALENYVSESNTVWVKNLDSDCKIPVTLSKDDATDNLEPLKIKLHSSIPQAPIPGTDLEDIIGNVGVFLSGRSEIRYFESPYDIRKSISGKYNDYYITIGNDHAHWYKLTYKKESNRYEVQDEMLVFEDGNVVKYSWNQFIRSARGPNDHVNGYYEKASLGYMPSINQFIKELKNIDNKMPFAIQPGGVTLPVPIERVEDPTKAGFILKPGSELRNFEHHVGLVGDVDHDSNLQMLYFPTQFTIKKSPFLVTIGSDTATWYEVRRKYNFVGPFVVTKRVFKIDGDKVLRYDAGKLAASYKLEDWTASARASNQAQGEEITLGSLAVPIFSGPPDESLENVDQLTNDDDAQPKESFAIDHVNYKSRHPYLSTTFKIVKSGLLLAGGIFTVLIIASIFLHFPILLSIFASVFSFGLYAVVSRIEKHVKTQDLQGQVQTIDSGSDLKDLKRPHDEDLRRPLDTINPTEHNRVTPEHPFDASHNQASIGRSTPRSSDGFVNSLTQ